MPDSNYIEKRKARNIIVGIFVFFLLALGGGLQLVKKQAQEYAVAKAVQINNRTTCALRSLVDVPIAGYERVIKQAQAIADDTSRSAKSRANARKTVANNVKTRDGLVKFRAVYSTIPPEYKCPIPQKVPNG